MRRFIVIFVMMACAFSVKAQNVTIVDTTICAGMTYVFVNPGDPNDTVAKEIAPVTARVYPYGTNSPQDMLILTLKFENPYFDTDAKTILETDLPYTYGSHVFPVGTITGTYSVLFQTIHGCDSTIDLTLTVNTPVKEMIITWLTDEKRETAYGTNSSSGATYTVFMEFYEEDLINYNSTNKSIVGINQIQIYLDSAAIPAITNCKVVIMQGKNANTATIVFTQNITNWTKNWNIVDLISEYAVDVNQRLYIGYEITINKSAFPCSAAKGTNKKQGWIRSTNQNSFDNLVDLGYGHVFLIKANAVFEDSPDNKILFVSINIGDRYRIQGENVTVKGTVKNVGKTPLTSFKVYYKVDGTTSTVETVSGITVAPGSTINFTHPATYTLNTAKFHNFIVTISEPNGVVVSDPTCEGEIIVCATKEQRVVLHEVFTSATCPPCKQGNEQITKILKAQDINKWACVKYQYYFPGYGDPYFTMEAYERGKFYGGIGGVPSLFGDGTYNVNPGSYTTNIFNQLANVPAAAKTTSTATVNIDNKKVDFEVTINPVTSYNNPNLRLFATIIEKITEKNIMTNGEKEFHYVMKKFMTSDEGDNIGNLTLNTPITRNLSYTFKGNYRLPTNAQSTLINHSTEHSVEDFKALMVVYWVQDIVTKEIFQAGKADPYPDYKNPLSITDIALNPSNVVLYPNPTQNVLFIDADVDISQLEIFNIQGQRVKIELTNNKEISTSALASGVYVLRITTDKGVSIHKFVKQ
jgi:hypothetical protein